MVKNITWFILVVCLLFTSCKSREKVVYLQDLKTSSKEHIERPYEVRIQRGDMLSIVVSASGAGDENRDLVSAFNLPVVTQSLGNSSGQQRYLGYLVDTKGCINFPYIGELKVEGLTRNELADLVRSRLKGDGLLAIEAVVTVQFSNFKVHILGEVSRPGDYTVNGERVTILEALSQAGDLTVYGMRNRVLVIRETGDTRTSAYLDLRNSELFNSPYYYLQQNDVIYVEPNKIKAMQRNINQNTSAGTIISILSLMISIGFNVF